ncbi:hypothetical protein CDAR_597171 [Caerostris darwini]|uniref:Uncharacterized protein n=1 Tax=Caerostris darwini TaxID=1538125 RepID=A0AAV4U2I0_9ARAC|nr:hypothetical protein CDAR_597171 [Caerostris darwini]
MFLKSCGNSVNKKACSSLPPTPTQGPPTCAPVPDNAGAFSPLYERREVPPFVFMRIGVLQEFCMNKCLLRATPFCRHELTAASPLTTSNPQSTHTHPLFQNWSDHNLAINEALNHAAKKYPSSENQERINDLDECFIKVQGHIDIGEEDWGWVCMELSFDLISFEYQLNSALSMISHF